MDFEYNFGRLIGVLSNEVKRGIKHRLGGVELTGKQRRIFHYIFSQSETTDVFQRDIEREFNLRRSSASEMLALLENMGIIHRESVSYDARLKRIAITQKGSEMREEVLLDCCEMENRLVYGIPEEELKCCASVMERMINNLKYNNLNKEDCNG
jgi:DNA-binding MarR family transcriptional regulator